MANETKPQMVLVVIWSIGT